ncbi:hypothetical protein PGT21_016204 [Puccinia graminis f. sp. tritici]|uniref:Uncharacterized protein n=1 Tax=Puccinia graminis f. sp. tritici TaxID=56615 RepID=A0A5B0PTM4_PUCGR|nr:hypothetical protein PGT21_016204 [Puccinia graminis f. sp. tritici]
MRPIRAINTCIASLKRCNALVSHRKADAIPMHCIALVLLKRVSLKQCDTDTGRFIASYRIVSS